MSSIKIALSIILWDIPKYYFFSLHLNLFHNSYFWFRMPSFLSDAHKRGSLTEVALRVFSCSFCIPPLKSASKCQCSICPGTYFQLWSLRLIQNTCIWNCIDHLSCFCPLFPRNIQTLIYSDPKSQFLKIQFAQTQQAMNVSAQRLLHTIDLHKTLLDSLTLTNAEQASSLTITIYVLTVPT